MVKCTGRGLVVKRPGVLSKDQMPNLVLGVGVFSLLPTKVDPLQGVRSECTVFEKGCNVGGQTRVDLATLAFFPCFIGFWGPINGVNLIKTL